MSNEKLRFAIIGTGSRGTLSFGVPISKRADADIVALYDPNSVRMEAASRQIEGEQRCYTSLDEMFEREKLDAVIITSPDKFHADLSIMALEHGVNVFVDKPLATTVADCKRIIDASEKTGKFVMIGFNLRHDPTLKRLKSIIDEGILGNIFLIENQEFYAGGRTYMSRWNRKYEMSGGLWIHKGSHDFDIFNWLLGFPKPLRVSATAGINVLNKEHFPFKLRDGVQPGPDCSHCPYVNECPDKYELTSDMWGEEATKVDNYAKNLCMYLSDKDVHDNGIAIVEYANGARASHMECFITSISDRRYTVIGDKGQAEVSLAQRKIIIRLRWSQEIITYQIPEVTGGHGGADPGIIETFIKLVKGETENNSTAEHGMLSTAIGQAAELAWREQRTVFIDELMK